MIIEKSQFSISTQTFRLFRNYIQKVFKEIQFLVLLLKRAGSRATKEKLIEYYSNQAPKIFIDDTGVNPLRIDPIRDRARLIHSGF